MSQKKQSEISTNQERKFQKLGFEVNISKSTLNFLVNFLPHCVPTFLAPLTLPFKNFNRAMFTTYYIKKTAENFTLNKVLLMLNAHFCFDKKFLYRLIAYTIIGIYIYKHIDTYIDTYIQLYTIFLGIKKIIIGPPNFFHILSVRRLKKIENHCLRQ